MKMKMIATVAKHLPSIFYLPDTILWLYSLDLYCPFVKSYIPALQVTWW